MRWNWWFFFFAQQDKTIVCWLPIVVLYTIYYNEFEQTDIIIIITIVGQEIREFETIF